MFPDKLLFYLDLISFLPGRQREIILFIQISEHYLRKITVFIRSTKYDGDHILIKNIRAQKGEND